MSRQLLILGTAALAVVCMSTAAAAGEDERDSGHHVSRATVAARQKIFGKNNVDARTGRVRGDKVIFSWITNASFAASIKGRVVLLDTFVTRLEVEPGRTPLVIQDLVDLQPEALLLGHGHFDHADNAAYLSRLTGANIYAAPETCENMQIDAARIFGEGTTVPCISITSVGSLPGSEIITIHQLEPVATIKAFKHLHSTNTVPQDPTFPPVIINIPVEGECEAPCNLADPRDASMFPAGTPIGTVLDITTSRAGQGGPISIFYQFKLHGDNHFTFAWHNTTGALREGCALPNNFPDGTPSQPGQDAQGCFSPEVGQRLAQVMRELGPTDLQIGSVVSLGYNINGERDIVTYNQAIAPKVFIPNHVTAVAVESSSLEWKIGYLRVQDAMGVPLDQRPELMWLVDPNDYLRPLVFDPRDDRWRKRGGHHED
jgi:flagellar motor switch/type III secretory pathway protein FliN